MFVYEKKLQYPVKISTPNPRLASFIISQYGGPDGELGASIRYLSQRYAMPYPELKGLLTDIGTEELGHRPAGPGGRLCALLCGPHHRRLPHCRLRFPLERCRNRRER